MLTEILIPKSTNITIMRVTLRYYIACVLVYQYKEALTIQLRKAQRHHDRVLLTRVIRVWADFAADEKIAQWHRERVAKEHNIEWVYFMHAHSRLISYLVVEATICVIF